MRTRLQHLMDKEGISPTRFAEIVGVQRSSVSHILSGRNNPSLDFIQKILVAFPRLNSDWLITGKGDVYRQITNQTNNSDTPTTEKQTNDKSTQNLFSLLKDEAPAKYNVPQKSGIDTYIQTPKDTQPDPDGAIISQELANGSVEKIVIFYKDRTFREYRPV